MPSIGSSSKNDDPDGTLSRRNTFQRMLDLERKNKLTRLQGSSSSTSSVPLRPNTSLGQSRDSSSTPNLEHRPGTSLASAGRAMTSPLLSVSIPPAQPARNATKKYVIMPGGQVVLAENEDQAAAEESDAASSICHSPGWDDLSGKKRKKEKREKEKKRKEKEKAESEAAKFAEKVKKAALKDQPKSTTPKIHKRLSKVDRSQTEPIMTQAQVESRLREATRPPVTDPKMSSGDRAARRGSVEISLKHFMQATHAIPVPWKSTHGTPAQIPGPTPDNPSSSTKGTSTRSTSLSSSGFIGGLKLRQVEDASVQETVRVRLTETKNEAEALLHSDGSVPKTINLSSGSSIDESTQPHTPTLEESVRTAVQWDSIYAQAAKIVSGEKVDETIPIMERNVKKTKKNSYPPTSLERYFPLDEAEDVSSSNRDDSIASGRQSATSTSYGEPGHDRSSSSTLSADRTRLSSPHPGGGYVKNSRRQSEDRSIYGYQDELQIQEVSSSRKKQDSHEKHTSFFRKPKQYSREPSVDVPNDNKSSSKETEELTASKATEPILQFLNEAYVPPELILDSQPERPTHERKSSGLKGIKAAFSRQSTIPVSVKDRPPTPGATGKPPRPQLTDRAIPAGFIGAKIPQPTKVEQILGEEAGESSSASIDQDLAPPPRSSERPRSSGHISARTGRQTVRNVKRDAEGSPTPPRGSRSRSTTGSSEDCYDTCNESSDITTPTASRPHSRIDHVISTDPSRSKDSSKKAPNRSALMSGGISSNNVESGNDSWCRAAVPLELTEDEDQEKTPTRQGTPTSYKKPHHEVTTSDPSNTVTRDSDLGRKPSLSRSISTPELQDLSFLPPLKHQALTRHHQEKGRGLVGKKNRKEKHVTMATEPKTERALVRPPPIPVSTTKSEGNSPTSPLSPISSQYLQNARLNLPRQSGQFPPKFPQAPSEQLTTGAEAQPIAKMFVICCSCKYFHDMPSKIYECMAKPDSLVEDRERRVSGVISTSVKCPWCGHGMSTSCCAGYAAVVYLRERLH